MTEAGEGDKMSAQAERQDSETTPIGGVPVEYLVGIWPKVVPILERVVLPDTGYTLDSVLTELQLARWQLWVIDDFKGAVVTQILDRPAERVLWVHYMAGDDMLDWLEDWVTIQDEYAASVGCTSVEFLSPRKGWEKIQKRFPNYQQTYAVWRKRLD